MDTGLNQLFAMAFWMMKQSCPHSWTDGDHEPILQSMRSLLLVDNAQPSGDSKLDVAPNGDLDARQGDSAS
jgi:hypothetical protein